MTKQISSLQEISKPTKSQTSCHHHVPSPVAHRLSPPPPNSRTSIKTYSAASFCCVVLLRLSALSALNLLWFHLGIGCRWCYPTMELLTIHSSTQQPPSHSNAHRQPALCRLFYSESGHGEGPREFMFA
ncbi:Protein of unknown function [Pyronema omphalodes CBS 100304]|uniref:Uncharacterized protein n=1 Tax=Pyronema omphalodes (strain CBS 100304) TaxID=1076935 RepID=U4LKH9_PYROM|nr:Protein of unknown function [Pyronema omphalodes CBS 100304]